MGFKHVDCVRALLPASNMALSNGMGYTALHNAIIADSEACFDLLLPISDVNVRTMQGVDPITGQAMPAFNMTPLHLACTTCNLPMCKALLSRGADLMARDSRQATPLHHAAYWGSLACAIKLVGQPGKARMTSAEVNAANKDGATALHLAACRGFDQLCAVLFGAGAWLDTKDSHGFSPLTHAMFRHPTNAALLALLSGSAPVQPPGLVCDHCGKTAEEASVKGLKVCRDCQDVRYCSKECQLAAWPGHKAACKARVKAREEKARIKHFVD